MRKALPGDFRVPCSLCHAKRGEACINIGQGSRFFNEVHRERRQASIDLDLASTKRLPGASAEHTHPSGPLCTPEWCGGNGGS